MQRYSMQPTDRLMRTDLNSRRIAAKTRITNYELVDKQPAGEVKMFYRSSKNYYISDGRPTRIDEGGVRPGWKNRVVQGNHDGPGGLQQLGERHLQRG